MQGGSVELPTLLCHAFITHVVTWPPLPLSPGVIPDCVSLQPPLCFPPLSLLKLPSQLNQAAGGHFFPFSIRDSYIMNASMVFSSSRCHGTAYGCGRRFFIVKDSEEKQFWREDLFLPKVSVHGPLVPCFLGLWHGSSPHWRLGADSETARVPLLPSLLCSSSPSSSFPIVYLL